MYLRLNLFKIARDSSWCNGTQIKCGCEPQASPSEPRHLGAERSEAAAAEVQKFLEAWFI